MKRILLFIATGLLLSCSPKTSVTSPDGSIKLLFSLSGSGEPLYSISVDGKPFIAESALGHNANLVNLKDGFHLLGTKVSSHKDSWRQPWGENKEITDNHRELKVRLANDDACLTLRFRVFDDGAGFRYEYKIRDSLVITDELTQFNVASDGDSWSIPANFDSYEQEYRRMKLSELQDANTPMTFHTDGGLYGSIHEAALVDFPEMTLKKAGNGFVAALAPDGPENLEQKAIVPGTFNTPWRTVQIGRKAVDLINSNLILDLNEPCALEDVSWIKPAKYVGVWWGMHLGLNSWGKDHRHGATTENAIKYIDFAADNNVDAVLFEGWNDGWTLGWAHHDFDFTRPAPDFDLDKVLAYAREKGVDYIIHHETAGEVAWYEKQLERDLDFAAERGIHSLKTGYAGWLLDGHYHHSQYGVRHYAKVAAEAAKRHIMVDAHEPIKETGLRRTYPNFMTREGARGMEWNAWSSGNKPSHHEILPFTRLLSGPMDYTPGIFDIQYKSIAGNPDVKVWNNVHSSQCRVNTTRAKQIALWVVLYSPMQMAADLIQNYEGHPAFQFFRDFNPDCDWSRALQGEIGEYVAIVRRAGDEFFYGAVTNEEGRTLNQPLSFLTPGVIYTATIYADAPDANWKSNPYAYTISTRVVTSEDTLDIVLAPGGGQAVNFKPVASFDDWSITVTDHTASEYYGMAMANGRLGILPGKEPFSVERVMLNHVFDYDDAAGVDAVPDGPVPFNISMKIDGRCDWNITRWQQTVDIRNAEHRTSFVADGKVSVQYRITALRAHPNCLLMDVSTDAPRGVKVEFTGLEDNFIDSSTPHGRYKVSTATGLIDKRPGHFVIASSIVTGLESEDPAAEARKQLEELRKTGVKKAIKQHRKAWEDLWKGDIVIDGDPLSQQAVRMALFNLYGSIREGTGLSVSPMGLTGKGYNGHVFWDSEMWMYPVMLIMNPGMADSMLRYRLDRMTGAAARAREFGHKGLMFPWESDWDGKETTPSWALTGPLEHHISADIAIAAWNRYLVTQDKEKLRECWPLLNGVARFLESRVTPNPDGSYSIRDVVGADEYAQHVDDNAFTNGSAKLALRAAVKAAGILGESVPNNWSSIAESLVIPEKDGITLDYAGYDGQLTKQADPNLLAYPLGLITDPERILRDLEYYAPRIDSKDGPAMTWGIFAVQYARLGDTDKAYEFFRRSFEPNLRQPFCALAETPVSGNPYFLTGAGALLQAVIYGFGGYDITPDGLLKSNETLPRQWKSLTITAPASKQKYLSQIH